MKENFRREYLRRTKLIIKSRLNGKNKIIAINTWAVSFMRYVAGIVKWKKRKLDEIDRNTRKVMTLNKELHPRSDVDRLHVSRMEGRRGLIGVCESRRKQLWMVCQTSHCTFDCCC